MIKSGISVEEKLQKCVLPQYTTYSDVQYDNLNVTYQLFGKPLNLAPVVVVIHALTGNSDVASDDKGWWNGIIGTDQLIDTQKYTVLSFNIPGNGYDGFFIERYKDFVSGDIARIFKEVLTKLGLTHVYAIMGGSLGGGIVWEMAALYPDLAQLVIPIATDWKSSDWVIGHNSIQESILLNSAEPLKDARMMAMLFYRTPISFIKRFSRSKKEGTDTFNVVSWLEHHGNKLTQRFDIRSYLMMNNLLSTIDITRGEQNLESALVNIKSEIIQIAIDSDLLFVPIENLKTKEILDKHGVCNSYFEIKSEDGHDAFLIEIEQIYKFLQKWF